MQRRKTFSAGDPFVAWMETQLKPSIPELESGEDTYRFLALQPIFDGKRKIFGYEILSRSGQGNHFHGDSDTATRRMVDNWVLYGFEELAKGFKAFLNCTRETLIGGLPTLLPRSTVLEVLETVEPDDEVLGACRRLKALGYQIALDDFQFSEKSEDLIQLADYIKIDFRLSDKAERKAILRCLCGRGAKLIAEKIETEEEFQVALNEGFQYFQGYHFRRPTVFSRRRAPVSSINRLRLIAALGQATFSVQEITELVNSEASICYRLLRLVNSGGFGLEKEVRSIQDALVMVGEEQFRRLAMLAIATETCGKYREEFLLYALRRARFLELMSSYTGQNPSEQYMFGLLSLMGAMLGTSLEDVVNLLPLRQEVKAALTGAPNEVARSLRILESYEKGDWVVCAGRASGLGLDEADLIHLYLECSKWADSCCSEDLKTKI